MCFAFEGDLLLWAAAAAAAVSGSGRAKVYGEIKDGVEDEDATSIK